jgi:hypothetical protein
MIGRNRQGLRKLSPDLVYKARDDTTAQVNRLLLTFVGTAAFCLLSLLSPDSALLGGSDKINVPFAGPVSFFGFMLLGPLVLIVLRVYLQIYVEHGDRLNRVARRMPVARAPTLVPLKNPLIRGFSGLTFYLLLPLTTLLFAWKAAVFPEWGAGLLCAAIGIIAGHTMLPLGKLSWRSKAWVSFSAAILAGVAMLAFGPIRRPFDLSGANLSGQSLSFDDLRGAKLSSANLAGAELFVASLSGANLFGANLTNANLNGAELLGADLRGAKLANANLSSAGLSHANLTNANLSSARLDLADLSGATVSQSQLDKACGTDVKLPPGLKPLKPCPSKTQP